jgi:hypothetical protein
MMDTMEDGQFEPKSQDLVWQSSRTKDIRKNVVQYLFCASHSTQRGGESHWKNIPGCGDSKMQCVQT